MNQLFSSQKHFFMCIIHKYKYKTLNFILNEQAFFSICKYVLQLNNILYMKWHLKYTVA
jgi:hypothetical protein